MSQRIDRAQNLELEGAEMPEKVDYVHLSRTYINSDSVSFQEEMDHRTNGAYTEYRKKFEYINQFNEVDYPIHIDIENVYACNLKCGHCARNYSKQPDLQYMDRVLYNRLIDEAAVIGTKSIGFTTWGEVFYDKDVFSKIEYACNKGIIDIRLHSNGILVDQEKANLVVKSGVTWIGISLDAATAETYAKVRGGNFGRAQGAIGYLINAKLKFNSFTPKLRVSFVKQKLNEHEVDLFRKKFQGVADVTIQQYRNTMGMMRGEDFYPRNYDLEYNVKKCIQPFERVYVKYNGEVAPCCEDIEAKLSYGNLNEKSLYDIFNSSKAKALRKAHKAECPPELCKRCLHQ